MLGFERDRQMVVLMWFHHETSGWALDYHTMGVLTASIRWVMLWVAASPGVWFFIFRAQWCSCQLKKPAKDCEVQGKEAEAHIIE